jgi:hypothetical protein
LGYQAAAERADTVGDIDAEGRFRHSGSVRTSTTRRPLCSTMLPKCTFHAC